MGWKATGQPTVRKQRDRWVVRLDGIDTESGKHRPRQLGTYASQRAVCTAASASDLKSGRGPEPVLDWLRATSEAMSLEESGSIVEPAFAARLSELRQLAVPFLKGSLP